MAVQSAATAEHSRLTALYGVRIPAHAWSSSQAASLIKERDGATPRPAWSILERTPATPGPSAPMPEPAATIAAQRISINAHESCGDAHESSSTHAQSTATHRQPRLH